MTDNNMNRTIKFTVPNDDKDNMRQVLRNVFDALNEKGYNPINQIVGYLLTEDPTYITNYNNARAMICKLDRDELLPPQKPPDYYSRRYLWLRKTRS